MEYPEHEKFSHEGVTQALLKGLEMAVEGDETDSKYGWYNGLWFAVKDLGSRRPRGRWGRGVPPWQPTSTTCGSH